MKRLFSLSISALIALFSFVSCEEDDVHGVVPEFGEMSFTPSTCVIGQNDSVTVRVSIKKKSKYAQKCTYYFRMTAGKYKQGKDVKVVSPGIEEPTVKMAVPDSAGVYTVTFSTSSIYFNADLPNGTIAAEANSVTGMLTVK